MAGSRYITSPPCALLRALRFLLCAVFLSGASSGFAQTNEDSYLLRLVHENLNGTSCVLLQASGVFHYESGDRDNTRVYEGEIPKSQLLNVEKNLRALSGVSQRDIQEPLIVESHDLLELQIFRRADANLLRFRSTESQEAYKRSLRPLVQWMDALHKLPHRELSEDAGKKNCLPPKDLALKSRSELEANVPEPSRRVTNGPPMPGARAHSAPVSPVIRFSMLVRDSSGARQRCALVLDNGDYRFEQTSQRNGSKKMQLQVARGQLDGDELESLRALLNNSSLTAMKHREPPGGMALNIMGAVLELSIARDAGVQELILTDSTHRSSFFYPGDGDVAAAGPLLQYVREHMEIKAKPVNASERNGCADLQ